MRKFEEKKRKRGEKEAHLFLSVLLSLLSQALCLVAMLLEHLSDLGNSVLEDLLRLVAVLRCCLLQLLQLGHDLIAAGDLLHILLSVLLYAVDVEAGLLCLVLGLASGVLDILLEVTGITLLDGSLDLLVQLLYVAGLKGVLVLLNQLLYLRVLLEVGLGLLHALVPCLITELLDLLDLLLHDALDLLDVCGVDAGLDDVADLLPCPVDLLLSLGAVLVAQLLQCIQVTANLLLQLGVVVHDLLGGVAREVGDAAKVLDEHLPCLLGGEDADVASLQDIAELAVGLADDGVDFITMLSADSIKVIEGSIDVSLGARDESSVALCGAAQPLESLVRLGCVLLDLLCGRVDVVLGLLRCSYKVAGT